MDSATKQENAVEITDKMKALILSEPHKNIRYAQQNEKTT